MKAIAAPEMRCGVLEPVRVWRSGAELDLGQRQQHQILALPLARADQPVGIAELSELLWADDRAAMRPTRSTSASGRCGGCSSPGCPPGPQGDGWSTRRPDLADTDHLDLLKSRDLTEQAKRTE